MKISEFDFVESASFATHVWGHFFKQDIQWARLHERQAFYSIAKQNCPAVFNSFIPQKKLQ